VRKFLEVLLPSTLTFNQDLIYCGIELVYDVYFLFLIVISNANEDFIAKKDRSCGHQSQ
jgi:hypothetical protein